jgi:hypothetical protein
MSRLCDNDEKAGYGDLRVLLSAQPKTTICGIILGRTRTGGKVLMDTQVENESCRVSFTERGMDVEGPCAEQFMDIFADLSSYSRSLGLEVSGYVCINPETARIERAGIYGIGTPTQSSLSKTRTCPCQQPQVTFHTHPSSGLAKLSNQDAITLTNRMNMKVDEGHCIVGESEVVCLFASHKDIAKRY